MVAPAKSCTYDVCNMTEIAPTLAEHITPRNALIAGSVVAAGLLVRNLLKKEHGPGENCFDIVHDLDQRIREVSDVTYFVAGGVSAAALKNKNTIIDPATQTITPPSDIFKAQYRENGTLGDLDLIVLTDDIDELDKIRCALTPLPNDEEGFSKPGAKLKIGVTGLKTANSKSGGSLSEGFVSNRILQQDGTITWEIVDITEVLSPESLQPWTLQLPGGNIVPVMHPVMQMICYGARTGHGIRKRDIEKLEDMEKVVGPVLGVKLNWINGRQKVEIERTTRTRCSFDEALDFLYRKNTQLHYEQTRKRLGAKRAGALAVKIALHRHVDTHDFYEQFGQGGPLFDKVFSKFTGERQQKLKATS